MVVQVVAATVRGARGVVIAILFAIDCIVCGGVADIVHYMLSFFAALRLFLPYLQFLLWLLLFVLLLLSFLLAFILVCCCRE